MFPLVLLLAASGPAQPPPVPAPPVPITLNYPRGVASPTPASATGGSTAGTPAAATPTAGYPSLADCLRACPPANDPAPFLRLPKVSVVEECQSAAACDDKCDPGNTWKHTWHTAARFTVPRFDLAGRPMEGDALVIYEGMTLTVNRMTGIYDLGFTATHPPLPVVLRLQLEFIPQPDAKTDAVRLTLPPIRFEVVDTGTHGDTNERTVRVHHRGQSDLFRKPGTFPPLFQTTDLIPGFFIDESARVVRHGTARFGSASVGDERDR